MRERVEGNIEKTKQNRNRTGLADVCRVYKKTCAHRAVNCFFFERRERFHAHAVAPTISTEACAISRQHYAPHIIEAQVDTPKLFVRPPEICKRCGANMYVRGNESIVRPPLSLDHSFAAKQPSIQRQEDNNHRAQSTVP